MAEASKGHDMKHQLHTEIEIDATPAEVWAVLTDLDGYAEWNPFVVSSAGKAAVGERLVNRIEPPGGKSMTFKPTVTEVVEHQTFEWLGRFIIPGIFDGRHRFELAPTESGGTRLTHTEQFSGILVRFMRSSLDTQTLAGFKAMNAALKARSEQTVGNGS